MRPPRLRPVDLAREHELSTQAVRNYEEASILPPADRTAHGYRVYGQRHVLALRAFVALVPAHGHATAAAVLRAVHRDDVDAALALLDASHAELSADRATLEAVDAAVRDPGVHDPAPAAASAIGPLARRLGVHPATVRAWERAGIVTPRRDPRTGYRVYSAVDVRDAHLAHQLRRGGYPLERIAVVVARVRAAGGVAALEATLDDWHARLRRRGLAMLGAAAALHTYLVTPVIDGEPGRHLDR